MPNEDGPLTTPTYLPSLEGSEYVRLVQDRFKEAEAARRSLDEGWLEAVAFTLGKQWHRYDWSTGSLVLPKAPAGTIRAQHNLIRPKVGQAAAAMVADIPLLDVEPMSTQERDRQAARVGKKLLAYLHERLAWEQKYLGLARWCVMTGTAFLKDYWNPQAQDTIAIPLQPQPMDLAGMGAPNDGMGLPMPGELANPLENGGFQVPPMRGKLHMIGQVASDLVSPFEMYPQPGAQSWADVEWVIHAKVRTLEYIRAVYPEKGQFVKGESEASQSGYLERRVADIMEESGRGRSQREEGTAVVLEYWLKPCPKYPRGLVLTVCNGVLLKSRPLPYRHLVERRLLPFTCFQYEPSELAVWGQGLVKDLIRPQKAYNRILSDLHGILQTTGKPKLLLPFEAKISAHGPSTGAGEILRYAAANGYKPEYWQPAAVPPVWLEMLSVIKQDMEDITQRHQVSAGSTPSGVTAGVSIQLLQESDNRAFGPIVTLFHAGLAEHGMQALALAKEFYLEARLGYVTGDDDGREIAAFRGSDLPDYADVRAVAASKTPMSRAAKQQQLFDLYDRGAFGPPGSPPANVTLLKRLEFGDVEDLAQQQLAYQQQQQMQQLAMQQAQAQQQLALAARNGQQQMALQDQKAQHAPDAADAGAEQQLMMKAAGALLQPAPAAPHPGGTRRGVQ